MPDKIEEIPQHNDLMWPTLKAIKELGGSAHISEILSKVAEIEGFSEEAQSIPHVTGNETRLGYRLAWARTYLKKGGALENSDRGVWSTTDIGEKLTEKDIPNIVSKVRRRSKSTAHNKGQDVEKNGEIDGDDWKEVLITILLEITPDAFERLTQRILRESGFTTVVVSGRSGDGGIDGTGILQLKLRGCTR
ncbi:MAG: winged helix-turn-helix domain-containing protein [Rhodospirillaceae bacterium]|nr:winged helix-turn-helix domain-containing protein [Rhodospirillaceae bacterium]